MWYTLADCVASKFLTCKAPNILRTINFSPKWKRKNLQEVKQRGSVLIDPTNDDFFKKLVEERQKVNGNVSIESTEEDRLEQFLKVLANATSYGIFIELNRQEGEEAEVSVFGLEEFNCKVQNPEQDGEFFFPVLGTLTTGAARLMLALAEAAVRDLGGTYAFIDTDSIAIVASGDGNAGGQSCGNEGYRVLSWAEVESIRDRFAQLNPYDPEAVTGSILDLEDENFVDNLDRERRQIQLWCYAVASKRYALFRRENGSIVLHKCSEHGLGNHLPPVDVATGKPVENWISRAWLQIFRS